MLSCRVGTVLNNATSGTFIALCLPELLRLRLHSCCGCKAVYRICITQTISAPWLSIFSEMVEESLLNNVNNADNLLHDNNEQWLSRGVLPVVTAWRLTRAFLRDHAQPLGLVLPLKGI